MKYNKIIGFALVGLMTFTSCDSDLAGVNENPNDPEMVPTYTIFNRATKRVMDNTRDGWMAARLTSPWVQYGAQINYVEEDRYLYRETTSQGGWNQLYFAANNFKKIIEIASEQDLSTSPNEIAAARVMLAYTFMTLADHWGDVPYWSYGSNDPEFQALNIQETTTPVYAPQSKIYADLLKELSEANDQFTLDQPVFGAGDGIYGGDASKWKKFANSLRLRIANRVKDVLPAAQAHITDAINDGVFESNADNAAQSYGTSSAEGNPFWATFFVDARTDFAVNDRFIRLLKGDNGQFGYDPRLQQMAAPAGTSVADVSSNAYTPSDDLDDYQGMPYGLPENRLSANNPIAGLSFASNQVISIDAPEILMEYSEVLFILSEVNGWDQGYYEQGVRASMEKWGVESSKVDTFVADLPAANEENVISQKYVALYMQPQEAWAEYRRTGYPDGDILLLPGGTGLEVDGTTTYVFTPLPVIDHMPYRVRYPEGEFSLNEANVIEASNRLPNGDTMDSKLWWMP